MAQGILDRLNRELEAFGRRAQTALDEGKLQIELLRVRRQRDTAARDLGLLLYRRERGGEIEQRRVDALMLRLDDLEREIETLERRTADAKAGTADASGPGATPDQPGPTVEL
jgi:50S ribosomal subunit-associated GTPase HflX